MHDKHLWDHFKVNEGVYRDKSHNHAMTAFCDLTTVSIEHMQNIAGTMLVQSTIVYTLRSRIIYKVKFL